MCTKDKKEVRYPLRPVAGKTKLCWQVDQQVIETEVPAKYYTLLMKRPAAASSLGKVEKKEEESKEKEGEDSDEGEESEEEAPASCEENEGEEEESEVDDDQEKEEEEPLKEGEEAQRRSKKEEMNGGGSKEKVQKATGRVRAVRKRPASKIELQQDFQVTCIYLIKAATGPNIRAYLLAKGIDQKKQLIAITARESRKYTQLVLKIHQEAIARMKGQGYERYEGLRQWALMRKAELLG